MKKKTKQEKIEFYRKVHRELQDFADVVVERYNNELCTTGEEFYADFVSIGNHDIYIRLLNQSDDESFCLPVPLDVFLNDTLDDFIKDLKEKQLKAIEKKKKIERNKALETIRRLKAQYNIP